MNKYTFRITQDLIGFYEGEVTIEAVSEQAARGILEEMSTDEIDKIAFDWEQNTDNAYSDGPIEIQEVLFEEKVENENKD